MLFGEWAAGLFRDGSLGSEAKDVSKKRDLDSIDDIDESTYELLGSKLSKLATASRSKDRFRERRASDSYDRPAVASRAKRTRDHAREN